MTGSSKLTSEGQKRLVCLVAAFETPSSIVAMIKREFDVTLTPQAVEAYDPTKFAGRNLAPKWEALFRSAREAFLRDTSSVGISQKIVRLRRLDRMSVIAEEKGNYALAMQLLEQAAKECGDMYTNRRQIDATLSRVSDPKDLTDEELAAIIMDTRESGALPEIIIRGGLPRD